MLNKEEFKKAIIDAIDERNILKHPFYQKWNEGRLTREELREYSKQYYRFVENFPLFVSSVHSNCIDKDVRKMIMENLADEEGFKSNSINHPQLWLNFCKALDVDEKTIDETKISKGVESMINGFYELCKNGDYKIGLAALLSYEYQIPEVSKVKIEGLAKYYNIALPEAIEFFTVHQKADIFHSRDEMNVLLENCTNENDQKNVLDTINKGTSLYWQMLDNIYTN